MDGAVEREKNGVFIGILVFLCVAIVGLVIGIVVVNANNGVQKNEGNVEYSLPKELQGDDLSPTDQVIKETTLMVQDPNVSNSEIEAYYDGVIADALMSGNTDLAMRIIIQKMDFIAVIEGNCAEAKEYVNNVDLSPYSTTEKSYLASYVVSMAEGCSGGELQAKWEALYNDAREK
ncbi:hypothetical protein IKF89_01680 [Candidatus Saccharibacteria bacterium]|nr:hypothetical protein [Candidatus Saccharibacteria bacterium]